jgi:capsular polysaccharide transport system permease protein
MHYDASKPAPLWPRVKQGFAKLRVAKRIWVALILREIMTRFGREQLGFLWLILEPLILTSVVMMGWYLIFGSVKHGVPIAQLALSGYSCLTLWRYMVGRLMNCFGQNAPLMFHLNVRPMDTIFARLFLETFGILIAFFTSFTFLYLLGWIDPIADLSLVLAGWFLLAAFSFSVALILSAISEFNEHADKLIQPFMYVTLPLTGVFTMMAWLPEDFRAILLYSPIVHAVEMFRAGVIGPQVETHWNAYYLIVCTIFTMAIGLLLMRAAETMIKIE